MANQLTKQYKEFQPGTIVKIKQVEAGMVVLTIPSSSTPNKKLLLPVSFVGRATKPVSSIQEIQQTFLAATQVSPGKPSVASYDWSKLDTMPITYPTPDPTTGLFTLPTVKVECYCGKSFQYYTRESLHSQSLERMAVDKAIAGCNHCSEKHSTASQAERAI